MRSLPSVILFVFCFFFVVVTILFLLFCGRVECYIDMSHLSKAEVNWVKCYNMGDRVLFRSNLNNVDTLLVESVFVDNTLNPFYFYTFDRGGNGLFNATCGYTYCVNKGTDGASKSRIDGYFSLKKFAGSNKCAYYLTLDNMTFDGVAERQYYANKFYKGGIREIKEKVCTINSHVIPNCLVIDKTNCEYIGPQNMAEKVTEFIISKEYGLIYYSLSSGENFVYELLLEPPNNNTYTFNR